MLVVSYSTGASQFPVQEIDEDWFSPTEFIEKNPLFPEIESALSIQSDAELPSLPITGSNEANNSKCTFCDKQFPYESKLKEHILSHLPAIHRCRTCNKNYRSYHSYLKHSFCCQKITISCPIASCLEFFYTQELLLKHLKNHNKPFVCSLCKELSHNKLSLFKHLLIHLN